MATTQRPHDDLEAQTVDVEELEARVDALSKGLAAARESDDELKDDLEAERQERRRLQETTERAVEILDSHGEPVTIARLVGTVVRLGARDEYRFETIVRVAQQHIDEECGGADR